MAFECQTNSLNDTWVNMLLMTICRHVACYRRFVTVSSITSYLVTDLVTEAASVLLSDMSAISTKLWQDIIQCTNTPHYSRVKRAGLSHFVFFVVFLGPQLRKNPTEALIPKHRLTAITSEQE